MFFRYSIAGSEVSGWAAGSGYWCCFAAAGPGNGEAQIRRYAGAGIGVVREAGAVPVVGVPRTVPVVSRVTVLLSLRGGAGLCVMAMGVSGFLDFRVPMAVSRSAVPGMTEEAPAEAGGIGQQDSQKGCENELHVWEISTCLQIAQRAMPRRRGLC